MYIQNYNALISSAFLFVVQDIRKQGSLPEGTSPYIRIEHLSNK